MDTPSAYKYAAEMQICPDNELASKTGALQSGRGVFLAPPPLTLVLAGI